MFGAGCFWGAEEAFKNLKGVTSTKVGYSGGHTKKPSYKDVCSSESGHAEVVYLEFDPSVISLDDLLNMFWQIHDPTSLNKQGPDIGTQYRSAVFYYSDEQLQQIQKSIECQNQLLNKQIVTEVSQAKDFWLAEEYHQCYLEKNGLGKCNS